MPDRTRLRALFFATTLALSGCGASSPPLLDLRSAAADEPDVTLVWVGRGECERFEDGAFVRRPEFDYEFTVLQRRYGDRWESVKTMRRLHPGYDLSAGPREQVMGFRLSVAPAPEGAAGELRSTLGTGHWSSDAEFRESTMELTADVSAMAPFDTYRIVQRYGYEAGTLDETVELIDGGPSGAVWVRNTEHARLFAAQAFDGPPSVVGR